jgi:hypothetical protein
VCRGIGSVSSAFRWLPIIIGITLCALFVICRGQLPGVGEGGWLPAFAAKSETIYATRLPEGVGGKATRRSVLFAAPDLRSRNTACSLLRPHFPSALPSLCGEPWSRVSVAAFSRSDGAAGATPAFWIEGSEVSYRAGSSSPPPGSGYYLWVPAARTAAILFTCGMALLIAGGWLRLQQYVRSRFTLHRTTAASLALAIAGSVAVALFQSAGRTSVLIPAALLLAAMAAMPRIRVGHGMKGLVLAAAAFIAVHILVQALSSHADAMYRAEPRRLARFVRDESTSKDTILLLGSSYTVHGVDPAIVEAKLEERGLKARVLLLASGGLSPIERMFYLREVLARTTSRPRAVLFEISPYYDLDPLRLFRQNRFTDRMIGMMDRASAGESLDWIWSNTAMTLRERLRASLDIVEHAALRIVGGGFVHGSETYENVFPETPSIAPQREKMPASELASRIEAAIQGDRAVPATDEGASRWAAEFYANHIAELRRVGIDRFGFYAVPTLSYADRTYSASFCSREQVHPCASMADEKFLRTLDRPEHWFDVTHLNGDGREMNSRWLAEWIRASGILK